MAGFLRKLLALIPSIVAFFMTIWYLRLRRRYPDNVPDIPIVPIVDFALYSFLYVATECVFLIAVIDLILATPLLNAIGGDTSAASPNTQPAPQPHDEESLVPERESDEPRGMRGFLAHLEFPALYASAVFVVAAMLRPRGSAFFQGTYQVLKRVVIRTGIFTAVLAVLPLLLFAPLLIIWIIVKRLTVEPHKAAWAKATAVCMRLIVGAFIHVLALESIALYQPQASRLQAYLPLLIWQASLLATLSKWFGLGTYPITLMWLFTDKTAKYFLDQALKTLSVARDPNAAPPSLYRGLLRLARFFLLPIAMICNGHMYTATTLYEGALSAGIAIAWATAGAFVVVTVDLAVYWAYFWRSGRRRRSDASLEEPASSPAEVMALALFGFAVRDSTGQTMWDQFEQEGSAEPASKSQEVSDTDGVPPSEKGEFYSQRTE
ncbi:hypothetical protein GGX14DRAFT_611464 [Mycena pura]|uniref:Uncharacterized protein n=1 Tax=Mycena pura TaxID=153505 RepID=A0AAD6YS45_9AGAR|nr:hypothetical protein GGX14DRAFT_611464 [Mycena pura]